MCFKISVLGTGSAIPTPERFSTAQVVNINEKLFLIDCGEGTQIQLRRFKIRFSKINHILISHQHGDHIYGLIGLISSFIILGRNAPLDIYSPGDIEELLKSQLKYILDDIPFSLTFHKVGTKKSELIYNDDKVEIKSIPLKHKIPTVGYVFKEKKKLPNIRKDMIKKHNIPIKEIQNIKEGNNFMDECGQTIPHSELVTESYAPRSFAFCSDTKYYERIISEIKNVDLLYHETTFMDDMRERASQTMHSTTLDAANIAHKAEVKTLMIGHYSLKYKDTKPLIDEVRTVFKNAIASYDGFEVCIKKTGEITGS